LIFTNTSSKCHCQWLDHKASTRRFLLSAIDAISHCSDYVATALFSIHGSTKSVSDHPSEVYIRFKVTKLDGISKETKGQGQVGFAWFFLLKMRKAHPSYGIGELCCVSGNFEPSLSFV